MGMNSTPSSERTHIGFFGRRNAGKSSLVNAFTGQEVSVVSEIRGTTTDPVKKSMELLPLGPVVIIDTPGYDDEGVLGEKRITKTRQALNTIDIAILVVDGTFGIRECERELIDAFERKKIPYLIAYNKCDLVGRISSADNEVCVSALKGTGIEELKERTAHLLADDEEKKHMVADLIAPGELVVLVIPIDKAAPKGRIILPQQMAIRDILDAGAEAVCCRDCELAATLEKLGTKPTLVITDSQVFKEVEQIVPKDIRLTSFSILLARYKGILDEVVYGAAAVESLEDGDVILMAEGCTHHRQCDDIGTVKIPRWLREYTGKELHFETVSGHDFPEDLSKYKMVVHCGGCMLTERDVKFRLNCADDAGIPMTNYGTCIAYVRGILRRGLEVFPELLAEMEEAVKKNEE